jgi:hypothetical protein
MQPDAPRRRPFEGSGQPSEPFAEVAKIAAITAAAIQEIQYKQRERKRPRYQIEAPGKQIR